MKRWVYVQAYNDPQFNGADMLSFRSTILTAKNEDDAYHLGNRWSDLQPHVALENDYVVEIPNA